MELFDEIGIKDCNGNDIFSGSIIVHNQTPYLIRWSFEQKQFVARHYEGMNWREFDWLKRCSKYIKMVGIVTDNEWKKFHELWELHRSKFYKLKNENNF